MIQLTFFMEPVGKARARTVVLPKHGTTHAYTPDKTAAAEAFIRAEAISWANRHGVKGFPIFEAGLPLHMVATFVRSKPKAMPKGRSMPVTKPDLDNYFKCLDALNGIIYVDDAQIVGVSLEKQYVEDGTLPRIELSVWEALPADQPLKKMARRKNDGKK